MKCPNCFAEIRYSSRLNNKCLKCFGTFVFEPKNHPLSLTDTFFLKTVDKLSDHGKIFFTPEQFHFALNQKKIRQSSWLPLLIFVAPVTFVPIVLSNWKAGIAVGLFWLLLFLYKKFYPTKIVKAGNNLADFDDTVLTPWKKAHKKLPQYLTDKKFVQSEELKKKLRAFLVCDTQPTVNFLNANHLDKNLGLFITTDYQNPRIENRAELPIFILHDAGEKGYEFAEKVKNFFENDRKISDIGLRPSEAEFFELPIFRTKTPGNINFPELTTKEIKWIGKGFYTPLFVLRPAHLIELVTNKIERKFAETENT